MTMSALDPGQIVKSVYNTPLGAINVSSVSGSLVPSQYDAIALTYVASGNGAGNIQTARYYSGGLAGTLVATLTLSYDGDDNISSVVKS